MDERELLLTLRPWLRDTASAMLAGHDRRHAEDLAQEGWIAVWKARRAGQYDGVAPLLAWCKTVARNRMRNVIRDQLAAKRDERRLRLVGDVTEVWDGARTTHAEPEADPATVAAVLAAVNRLSRGQRAYVLARFWDDLTADELAAMFGRKAQYPLWYRARARLAEELAELAGAA